MLLIRGGVNRWSSRNSIQAFRSVLYNVHCTENREEMTSTSPASLIPTSQWRKSSWCIKRLLRKEDGCITLQLCLCWVHMRGWEVWEKCETTDWQLYICSCYSMDNWGSWTPDHRRKVWRACENEYLNVNSERIATFLEFWSHSEVKFQPFAPFSLHGTDSQTLPPLSLGLWSSAVKGLIANSRVREELLPQVEDFKYLGASFMSEGKMEQVIGAVSAVVWCYTSLPW